MKPRWLFIDSAKSFGGHEVMLLRLIAEIAALGVVDVRLLSRSGTALHAKGSAFHCKDQSLPAPALSGGPIQRRVLALRDAWQEFRAIFRAVRQENPSLCIVATGHLGYLVTVLATRLAGRRTIVYVPLVDSFTTMGYRLARFKDWVVRTLIARLPHAWITITTEQAQSFSAWAKPSGPIHCLPNAVSPDIENLGSTPGSSRSPSPLRVLVFGRLDAHQKGLDLLITHLENAALAPEFHRFSIVGDGPYRAELEQRVANSHKLTSLLSLASWGAAIETMRAHDVLLLPSRFEGVPLVMLEAMALGLPIVASDLPATRAYLPAECLFAIGDLASAMKKIDALREPEMRASVISRNKRYFEETSSGQAFSKAVLRLIEGLQPQICMPEARNALSDRT